MFRFSLVFESEDKDNYLRVPIIRGENRYKVPPSWL